MPVVETQNNFSFDFYAEAHAILEKKFGHTTFREGQLEAVQSIFEKKGESLVVLPTGAGKSICFQIPGLIFRAQGQGPTVVISPLIALMNDQVEALNAKGINAKAVHSQKDEFENRSAMEEFLSGSLDFLYVAPERAVKSSFVIACKKARPAFLVIDEAHCISQWGHDFRPDYRLLHQVREALPSGLPVMAVTATATVQVIEDIQKELGFKNASLIKTNFFRPNLSFYVLPIRQEKERITHLASTLEELGFRETKSISNGRVIIYAATRKKVEKISSELKSLGFHSGHYHAGRTELARERAQNAFALGKTPILVATNAFGMGIDCPDVRLIAHFQCPGSVEAYYQEAGRAGRDGVSAHCLLYYGEGDLHVQRNLSQRGEKSQQKSELQLDGMIHYARGRKCRQVLFNDHFNGLNTTDWKCERCDACLEPEVLEDRWELYEKSFSSKRERKIQIEVPKRARKKLPLKERSARIGKFAPRTPLVRALEKFMRVQAKRLGWKPYMVFHKKVIVQIDSLRPQTLDELEQISGLGPSKIERFGEELLSIIRRYDTESEHS